MLHEINTKTIGKTNQILAYGLIRNALIRTVTGFNISQSNTGHLKNRPAWFRITLKRLRGRRLATSPLHRNLIRKLTIRTHLD